MSKSHHPIDTDISEDMLTLAGNKHCRYGSSIFEVRKQETKEENTHSVVVIRGGGGERGGGGGGNHWVRKEKGNAGQLLKY